MSSAEYYLFDKDGKKIDELEFRNGHGCMPVIWGYYSELLRLADWEGKVSRLGYMMKMDELCRRAVKKLSPVDRLLMALTWEPVFVSADLFPAMGEALEKVIRNTPSDHVNHWPMVLEWIKKDRDVEVAGYGHYTTSVNDNNWLTRPEPNDDPDVDPWEDFEQKHKSPSEVLHVRLGGEGLGHTQPDGETVWLPPSLR